MAERGPRTAVVTITSGRDAHLHRQRTALAAASPDLHVVVGMGERPTMSPLPQGPPTTLLEVPVPASGLPLAAARNTGAAAAMDTGVDLLVFLDVDCIPAEGMLGHYLRAAERVHRPALLCGPVAYLPPPPPEGYPATGLSALASPHPGRPVPPDGRLWPDTRYELFWSLSFAITASTWSRLGGFHEGYTGYGGEDTDFGCTAEAAGVPLYWVGGALAHHQHHAPTRATAGRAAEVVRNARLFRRRWGWWPMRDWLTEMARDGLVEFDAGRDVLRLVTAAGSRPGTAAVPRRSPGRV